jgi:hypothetical protein
MSINIEAYRYAKKLAKNMLSLSQDNIELIANLLEKYIYSLPPNKQEIVITTFNKKPIPRKEIPKLFREDPEFRQHILEILKR